MDAINYRMHGDELVISLSGRITAANSAEIEASIDAALQECPCAKVVLDLDGLTYISSAGLRVFLRLGKRVERLRIENAGPVPYDVLEMTGFSEMFEVTKAYRRISTDGLEVIGRGAKGAVYRIDDETIVKVSFDETEGTIEQIDRERKLARSAFVAGIPTAISYDVVRVGNGYGAVYELLNAFTLNKMLRMGIWSYDEAADAAAELLAQMHDTHMGNAEMPSSRGIQLKELPLLEGKIPEALYSRIMELVGALPDDDRLIHGDFHIGNVMVQNGELLLIDMDTLSKGSPVLELGPIYNAYVGFGEIDHAITEDFQGLPYDEMADFWNMLIERYSAIRGLDAQEVLFKGEAMGRIRQVRRIFSHNDQDTPHGRAVLELNIPKLEQMLAQIDTLEY